MQAYPALSPALSKTYFEVLLLTEMALQLGATVNVAAFFPTWVRGVLKKGVFSVNADARRESGSVPVQLQQKRAKVSGVMYQACNLAIQLSAWASEKVLL